jgi:hypothetical protein
MWVQFFLWIATTLITDYFRDPLPTVTASGLGDFTIPTATEGRFVPLCFGTHVIQGPNVTWYGDFEAVRRTVTTGLVFKRDETIGFTYWLGMQMGLVRGQTAGIRRIWIGDDIVWDADLDNGGNISDVCDIDREDLFGGKDGGGGFQGRVRLYDGSPTQGQSDYLKYKRRLISESAAVSPQYEITERFTNLPNFRGFSYVTISNIEETRLSGPFGVVQVTEPAETKGANIGETNNMRYMKFEIQTFDTIANGGEDSLNLGNDHHIIGQDLNPIVLAYDVFTNTDWGRGFSVSDMNLASFQAAAETIWNEGLGMSIVIDQVQKAADLIDTIEQHVDGYIGPNPIDGRIEVILARQDYTPASEFQADATNIISVKKYSRGDYNQTYNEVRVQFLDRTKDYKDGYAPAQDLANLIIQGRPRSKTMRFSGVKDPAVANKIVWREMKGLAVALASATVEIDRTAWNLQPGKVVVVTDDEIGISNIPFRIIQIRQGDPVNATILLDIIEDVFGNETTGFVDPPPSEFIPPTVDTFALAQSQQMVMEAPYIINRQALEGGAVYPRLYTGASTLDSVLEFEVNVDQTVATSPTGFDVVEPNLSGVSMIVGALKTTLPSWTDGNGTFTIKVNPFRGDFNEIVGSHAPGGLGQLSGVCVINPGASNEEWVITDTIAWDSDSPTGGIELQNTYRAALDSAMWDHSIGEPIWFIWTGSAGQISDDTFALSNTLTTKLLPIAQTNRVNLTDSPEPPSALDVVIDSDARYYKPLLPIELVLNDVNFPGGSVSLDSSRSNASLSPDSFTGIEALPKFRLFRVENVVWQVEGLDAEGGTPPNTAFTDDELSYSWWFYNLDSTTANSPQDRTDALVSQLDIPVTDQVTPFAVLKSALEGLITVNSFNARLEIETYQRPFDIAGSPATNRASRNLMLFEFTATGLFVIDQSLIEMVLSFNGTEGSRHVKDRGPKGHEVIPYGGAEIDTASSVFGGASMFTANIDAANSSSVPKGAFIVQTAGQSPQIDWKGQDWTVEFRIRNDGGNTTIDNLFGVMTADDYSWRVDLSNGFFRLLYSQNGSTESAVTINGSNPFTPGSPDFTTWRSVAIVKRDATGSPDGNTNLWQLFIDGVFIEQRLITSAWLEVDGNFYIGSEGMEAFDEDGLTQRNLQFDEFRVTFLPLYSGSYTPDTEPFVVDSVQNVSLHVNFDPYEGRSTQESTENADGMRDLSMYDEPVYSGLLQDNAPSGNPANQNRIVYIDAPQAWGSPVTQIPAGFCDGINSTVTGDSSGYWVSLPLADPSSPQYPQFEFGPNDWTMEGWFRAAQPLDASPFPDGSDNVDGYAFLAKYNRPSGNSVEWHWRITTGGQVVFTTHPNGFISDSEAHSVVLNNANSPSMFADTEWHHVALQRRGRRITHYYDGVITGSDGDFFGTTEELFNGPETPVSIGRFYDVSVNSRSRGWYGWITEVRITKEAKYPDQDTSPIPSPDNITIPNSASPGSPLPVVPSPQRWPDIGNQVFTPPGPQRIIQHRAEDYPVLGDGVASDWVWADTVFLCKWNGGVGSPATGAPVDESNSSKTVTLRGTGILDTTQSRFGGASLRCTRGTSPSRSGASIPDAVEWQLDQTPATLETWVRFASLPAASPAGSDPDGEDVAHFMGQWNKSGTNNRALQFGIRNLGGSPNVFELFYRNTQSGSVATQSQVSVAWDGVTTDTWYHVAVTIKNRFAYLFIDGDLVHAEQYTLDNNANESGDFTFGHAYSSDNNDGSSVLDGWLDDTRITIGSWLYTEDYTPQEHVWHDTILQPGGDYRVKGHASIEDFSFLANAVTDRAQDGDYNIRDTLCPFSNPPTTGFARSYATSIEWANQESNSNQEIAFQESTSTDLLDGEFTIESWVYLYSQNRNVIGGQYNATGSQRGWILQVQTDGYLNFLYSDNGTNLFFADFNFPHVQAGSPSNESPVPDWSNAWHHIAVVRDNNYGSPEGSVERIRMFWDGQECQPTGTYNSPQSQDITGISLHTSTADLTIGGYGVGGAGTDGLNGALDQFRIVKGHCLYRENFTPPTGRFNRF